MCVFVCVVLRQIDTISQFAGNSIVSGLTLDLCLTRELLLDGNTSYLYVSYCTAKVRQ